MVTTKINEKILIDKYNQFIKEEKLRLEQLKKEYQIKKKCNDIESVKMNLGKSKNKFAMEFSKKYDLNI